MIITFCGHSKIIITKEEKEKIKNFLINKIKNCPNTKFYLGGYGDFDYFIYYTLKVIKQDFKDIELVYITPYLDTDNYKLQRAKETYDSIIYPPLEFVPKKLAILKRNEWMVNNSDLVVAYVKRSWGGARKTLNYAIRKHKSYINFGEE